MAGFPAASHRQGREWSEIEPYEEVTIDIPDAFRRHHREIAKRRGQMADMKNL
jgi:predicted membrane GTPase involved in stress response